jgi:hypothetical protein
VDPHNNKIDSKSVVAGGTATISFGNVCLGPGGGLTLGFWSNKNGQALISAADLTALRDNFKLRNADGSEFKSDNKCAGEDVPSSARPPQLWRTCCRRNSSRCT